jgi:uncharacterized protein YdbL (DUF1318 family)
MALTASDLAALKSSLEFWEIVEYVATTTVLIGVVGEYVAEFTKFAEKRGIERKLGKLSTLILIVGLAAELLGLVRTSQLSGHLVASLEEQSSQATYDAAEANERAKKYQDSIAEANARAAEAMKAAEQERLARVKIEEKLAWRDLNPEKQRRVEAKLKKFTGTEFEIRVFQEPEALHLLNIMVEILHLAGWIQRPVDAAMEVSTKYGAAGISVDAGIRILADPKHSDLRVPASALAAALLAEGIDAVAAEVLLERHPERIHILIGKKR